MTEYGKSPWGVKIIREFQQFMKVWTEFELLLNFRESECLIIREFQSASNLKRRCEAWRIRKLKSSFLDFIRDRTFYESFCESLWGWMLQRFSTRNKAKHHFSWIILSFWLKSAWFQFDCMHPSHCSYISTTINQDKHALPCSTKFHYSVWLQFGKERRRIVRNWAVGLQMKLRRNT